MQEYTETLSYRVFKIFSFMQPKTKIQCRMEALSPEEREQMEIRHRAYHFNLDMNSNEEMVKIRRAKKLWQLVRRKKRVILMMSKLGEGAIYDLDQRRYRDNK